MIKITIEDGGQYQIARVSGEFGADDGLVIADELSEYVSGEGAALVLELSALAFINSSGLAALMNLATRARLSHGRLVLVNPYHPSGIKITRAAPKPLGMEMPTDGKGFTSRNTR